MGGGPGVSCSRFGGSNPGSNPIGHAFARVEGGPAGGNPGAKRPMAQRLL